MLGVVLLSARGLCADPPPPNFVLIVTDDQGYSDLGCYGSPNIRTPQLDRIAAEGLRLTSFYTQPVCGVSRAALLTGCYPIRVAEPGNIKRLHTVPHAREVTLAEVLRSAGYATACIGKWHLGLPRRSDPTGFDPATMPNAQGFDHYFGTPLFNGTTVRVEESAFRSRLLRDGEVVQDAIADWNHITADYTHAAVDWITRHRARPFFLYLAHNMPHIPLGASERFRGRSAAGPYGDAVEELDWSCGEILRALQQLGLDERTLVLFTSDNGPWIETTRGMKPGGETYIPRDHSGHADPLRGWKMSGWEGGSRVPCLIRWPGRIAPGQVSDELQSSLDLLPTFARLASATLPEGVTLDGCDLSPLWLGSAATGQRSDYLYYAGCRLLGVRDGRFKLVLPRPANPPGTGWWGRMIEAIDVVELYDLDADPGETRNVAADHPDVVQRLQLRVAAARADLGDLEVVGSGARFFDDGQRRLEPSAR